MKWNKSKKIRQLSVLASSFATVIIKTVSMRAISLWISQSRQNNANKIAEFSALSIRICVDVAVTATDQKIPKHEKRYNCCTMYGADGDLAWVLIRANSAGAWDAPHSTWLFALCLRLLNFICFELDRGFQHAASVCSRDFRFKICLRFWLQMTHD